MADFTDTTSAPSNNAVAPEIRALAEKWKQARCEYSAAKTVGEEDSAYDRSLSLEGQVMALPTRTAGDLAIKLCIETRWGDNPLEPGSKLLAEAIELSGFDRSDATTSRDTAESTSRGEVVDEIMERTRSARALFRGIVAMVSEGDKESSEALIYEAQNVVDDIKDKLDENYSLLVCEAPHGAAKALEAWIDGPYGKSLGCNVECHPANPLAWLAKQGPFAVFAAIRAAYDAGTAAGQDDADACDAFMQARNAMVQAEPKTAREFSIQADWLAFDESASPTEADKKLLKERIRKIA